MNDTLRTLNLLPAAEPYSALTRFGHIGGEQVNPGVFTVTGNNAIVDWVLVELRSPTDATRILATRAALVQRDGDVVDMDGVSPVVFANQNLGSYYVVVGHRNHLRVMTAGPVTVNRTSAVLDFTNPNTPTYGNYAQAMVGTVRALWAGDANTNNQVINAGPNNDQNAVLTRVLTDPGNPSGNTNYVVTGYGVTDLNLDGKTIAAGPNNEMNVILVTVLTHPSNSSQNANYVVQEQVPLGVWTPPRAASIPLPASVPDTAAYIIQNRDFTTLMSAAAKVARWQRGEPVPATAYALKTAVVAQRYAKAGLMALVPVPIPQATQSGWGSLYSETFDGSNFPTAGQYGNCAFELRAKDQNYQWGRNTFRRYDNSAGAAWPAAGGNLGPQQQPGSQTYPENLQTQIICRFSNLTATNLKNFMVEFALWLDEGDVGDKLFVGFNTGETAPDPAFPNDPAKRIETFSGREWRKTPLDSNGNPTWQRYRLFYPELVDKVTANSGKLAVMWSFTSDGNRRTNTRGAWLDNLKVERYLKPSPPSGVQSCEKLNPTTEVPGAVGPGSSNQVSKGLALDAYTEDDLAGRMARLTNLGTDWVRIEFKIDATARLKDYTDATIDLKRYDDLLDSLCASRIAVLGLLSYETLYSQSWKRFNSDGSPSDEGGVVNEDGYLDAFVDVTKVLGKYFDDRIGYWEIWNEPDYLQTRLRTNQYPILLKAAYDAIKGPNGVDTDDTVVWGGLGGINEDAFTYFRNAYASIVINYPGASPFNIFALHPYYFADHTGKLMLKPGDYLHYDWASDRLRADGYTPIEVFRTELAQQDRNKAIWITEIGWNSAKESAKAGNCPSLQPQHVTTTDQSSYLLNSFDILFKQTGWNATTPAITKIFWYQYRDTGVQKTRKECGLDGAIQSTAVQSPSWGASSMARYQSATIRNEPNPADTPWQYGLYQGDFVPKLSATMFSVYPLTYNFYIYLPSIRSRQISVNASNLNPDSRPEQDGVYMDDVVSEPVNTLVENDSFNNNFNIYLPVISSEQPLVNPDQ